MPKEAVRTKRKLAVIDLETDPFEYGQCPEPFAAGLYDGESYTEIWNDDCVSMMVDSLSKRADPLIIFAHNGGKFDYFYFLQYLSQADMRIINGRIIQARLGEHELRDSYSIMPFPLRDYQKDEIDYNKLHRSCREQHKDEILKYLKSDCVYLHELVIAFFDEFGDKLTVGSSSMSQLQKFHKFQRGGAGFDKMFREDFYFGGRNQCFETGVIRGDIKIYDVNSMYPDAMRRFLHPIGIKPHLSKRIEHNTCFVVATGKNYGAFPTRAKNGSLDFAVPYGKFSTTIHEWNAALETGSFVPEKIHKTYGFDDRITFEEFVMHFYNARLHAKETDDKIHALFYKFVLNSGYGKFAQDPNNYFEWFITKGDEQLTEKCHKCPKDSVDPKCESCNGSGFRWTPAFIHQGKYTIWQAPLLQHFYFNITTGASITGAARSQLLRGLKNATRPIYCDTDSIICEGLSGVPIDENQLGAWKLEGTGTVAAICGKKLYAVYAPTGKCVECKAKKHDPAVHPKKLLTVKKASKGVYLSGDEILRIAYGAEIEASNPVPNFRLDGSVNFVKRKIRRTA